MSCRLTRCLHTQQAEHSAGDSPREGVCVGQPCSGPVGLRDVVQAAGQVVVRGKGAEHSLDEVVGLQHCSFAQVHVDHVQYPGGDKSQEADKEVANVQAAQRFHLILHRLSSVTS